MRDAKAERLDEIVEKAQRDDPVLDRIRGALDDVYGDRLDQIILFGSRARGDAQPNSDYDVAIFLRDMPDRWRELDQLANLCLRLLDETGAFVVALPYLSAALADHSPLLMHEIRRDGRRL